jgi:hypothetical protein
MWLLRLGWNRIGSFWRLGSLLAKGRLGDLVSVYCRLLYFLYPELESGVPCQLS